MISFFYILAITSSCMMLSCTNPINSVLFLISTFLNTSIIFFFIGCDFLGLIFVIIYLGAIAVLFLFIVMMVNVKKIEGDTTTYLVIGLVFFFCFFLQLGYYIINLFEFDYIKNLSTTSNQLYFFDEISKIDYFNKKEYFLTLGKVLYFEYFFFMVVVSLLLLIGMVGSIFLTNYKNNFSSKKQFNQLTRNSKLFNIYNI